MGSVAEAELLSQLSAILMPDTEIRETRGILKKRTAALFVEYDGYWRHGEKEGMAMDRKKNAALLDYAPAGSFVVRITHHSILNPFVQGHILWITVPPWQAGEVRSLVKTLQAVLAQMVTGLRKFWQPSVLRRMEQVSLQMANKEWTLSEDGQEFTMEAAENLKPKVKWLLDLELSKTQVAKAVASYPPILWRSIEKNLKPKAALLRSYLSLELGSLEDFANWVASCPRVFSYRPSRLSERLTILAGRNETAKLATTHMLPNAEFFDIYGSPAPRSALPNSKGEQ
ncbi:Protein aardvark [Durusdinium trenchii]|uniref:Protein aardvark n=1 Tax=Durusdinium trenchii TaxID=1381693 RepID=A0ABP0IEA6_9DINO